VLHCSVCAWTTTVISVHDKVQVCYTVLLA
jgi:hypothetical protein